MTLLGVANVAGLPQEEKALLDDLCHVYEQKKPRNETRQRYYDAHNRLKDLQISIPPQLRNTETVIGWAAKAVDALAVRSRFDGFTLGDGTPALLDVVAGNHLRVLYQQATTSELTSSCSFMTVSAGWEDEPDVIVSAYSALNAAGLWDARKKRIKAGMSIVRVDPDGREEQRQTVSWVNLFTDSATWEIKRDESGLWSATAHPHKMGRPMMEPLTYRPSLDRPFGKSRISRAVMSITDSAVRAALRAEVGAEFFTSPQKYVLGADDGLFEDTSRWEAYIGNIFALSDNEDGERVSFGQLPQGTMQPHVDYMRSLAARFSGETSIPVSELGVIHDNPASAEAIFAAKESLVIEAESLNETNAIALQNIGRMALAAIDDVPLDELDGNKKALTPHFKNPAMPSIVSQADAMVKIASAAPYIAQTEVFLEELGFDEATRQRLLEEKAQIEQTAAIQAAIFGG